MMSFATNEESSHNMERQESLSSRSQFTAVNSKGYLWTPPENTVDSFSQDETMQVERESQNKLAPLQAHTPPASPQYNTLPDIATATGLSVHDSPLYPERRTDRARSQTPLFEGERSQSIPRAQSAPTVSDAQPIPSVTDARTTLAAIRTDNAAPVERQSHTRFFPEILGITTPQSAVDYWNSRINELRDFRKEAACKLPSPKRTSRPSHDWLSDQQLSRLSKPAGVSKTRTVPKMVTKPKASTTTSQVEKTSPPKRRTPKARTYPDFVDSAFPSAQQPTKHKRAPPSKKVEGDNVNWNELPNYAPPISTLESNAKALKATWHGNPVDLSADPDRAALHPQELQVAATLRLSCAQYMTNKRKIFQARLQTIKDGKNFTKTAAQGACSIDVNKASQLWEAFDRVGWLNTSWFEQYL